MTAEQTRDGGVAGVLYHTVILAVGWGFLGTAVSWIADATRFMKQGPINVSVFLAMAVVLVSGSAYLFLTRGQGETRRRILVKIWLGIDVVLFAALFALILFLMNTMKDF